MARKFGVVLRRVESESPQPEHKSNDYCPVCGRTHAECAEWWDKKLGVTGHAADSTGGVESQYHRNLRVSRQAKVNGDDPYCFDGTLASDGYSSEWTPKLPESSLELHPNRKAHGKKPKGNTRGKSGRKATRNSRGSGRGR